MLKQGRKLKKMEKLNLVPILDSVFIFIFFLLMSAQFIDVYEIGSNIPISKEVPFNHKKEPLNLVVELSKEKVVVKTGMRSMASKTFTTETLDEMTIYLEELKIKHPDESTMILKSDSGINFQDVVKVIDYSQGHQIKNRDMKLFDQIVFDEL